MQNKKNNSNSRNRSDFDGPSDVIINCKSSGKFMDFRNDLVAAYPKDYANIQGFGGAKHARNSGIRITLTEYLCWCAGSALCVRRNVGGVPEKHRNPSLSSRRAE